MDGTQLVELVLTHEEIRILHQALNNALEFIPEGDFSAVMGVETGAVEPLMLKLEASLGPQARKSHSS